MSESELIRNTAEIVASATDYSIVETAQAAGGFVLKEAGRVVIGGLVSRAVNRMFEGYKQGKESGSIPPDFEETDHGAKLLQEALNAMSEGLDEDQADAVRRVFLGLASNPPEDSMERIQQIHIIETAASLTPWEIAALNLLERTSNRYYEADLAEYCRTTNQNDRGVTIKREDDNRGVFSQVVTEMTGGHEDFRWSTYKAIESLEAKRVLVSLTTNAPNRRLGLFVCDRRHWFTDYGWRLAVHLYDTARD